MTTSSTATGAYSKFDPGLLRHSVRTKRTARLLHANLENITAILLTLTDFSVLSNDLDETSFHKWHYVRLDGCLISDSVALIEGLGDLVGSHVG